MCIASVLKEYGPFIGACIASAAALFLGAGGTRLLQSIFYKPHIKFVAISKCLQSPYIMWRIVLRNDGKDTAEDVQADVARVIDKTAPRVNYIPFPLTWTHLNNEIRNVLKNQTVYIDLISELPYFDCTISSRSASYVPSIAYVGNDDTQLEVTVYQKNGHNIPLTFICKRSNATFEVQHHSGKQNKKVNGIL